jgi:tetratricopeptide (TPR) repeat protein
MASSPAADIARAELLAEQALAVAPRRALTHFAVAQVLRAQHRYPEAIAAYEATVALNPNWAHAYSHLGWCRFMSGEIDALIPAQERAIRISPRDPQIGLFYSRIGCVHMLQERFDEALMWLERARAAAPEHPQFRAFLAATYALTNASARAAAELAEARKRVGDDRYSSSRRLLEREHWGVPAVRALADATYLRGLAMAGMPER